MARAASGQPGPALKPVGSRILVAGASSDIGSAVLRLLAESPARIGAHYFSNRDAISDLAEGCGLDETRLLPLQSDISTQASCHALVDSFVEWAGGIDAVVQLTGDVTRPCSWKELREEEWLADLNVNLSGPFFLAQRAMRYMEDGGGRIVLTSTASAQHGGGATSMAYGVAKAGVECLTKGLAREGARHTILVNAVAPGFINTKFHTARMKRDEIQLAERAELVPLRRPGTPGDVASMIIYLLSEGGSYITGQVIPISGGDWL